ncbi:MAG TPA: hypothetical protein VFO39_00600 [Candidatus Sulfotelmatobacter sp.]|nr:hypothetical protein [Candidatus Sulfotelmatobacter sp.]
METALRAQGRVGFLPENIAGALAYLTFIPAVLFLLLDPYRRSRFLRFHSLQCLFFWAAIAVLGIALRIAAWILLIIPVLGHLLTVLITVVLVLALFFVWLVLVIKALQGAAFHLPILGDLAEQPIAPSSVQNQ